MNQERRLPRCLPVAQWPEQDRTAWANAISADDIFDGSGLACHWRAPTRRFVEQAVGRYFGWRTDEELQMLRPLPDDAVPEKVRDYCALLGARVAPFTAHGQIRDLVEFCRVAWPERDRTALQRAEKSLRWRAVPTKDKRSRLKPIPELVALGTSLMAVSRSLAGGDPRMPLTRFRDGFAIAFLACRPLRIRAFGSLQLRDNLVRSGETWKIIVPPELSKIHRHWEADFPTELMPALTEYLTQVRPQLMQLRGRWHSDPGPALWISNDGSALKPKALAEAITKRTGEAFDRPISPHFFRDCLATTLAQDSPENVRLATPMLGHTHPKMTEKHYNQASQLRAGRKHIDAMAKLRRSLR